MRERELEKQLIDEVKKRGGMCAVSYTHLDVYKRQEENASREDDYIPDISTMGDFTNLKYLWDDLKKNSVKQY